MNIKLSEFGKRADADIAESTKNILAWTSFLQDDVIKVMVEGSVKDQDNARSVLAQATTTVAA